MPSPAIGTAALFGLGREQQYGVPGATALLGTRFIPALDADLVRTSYDSKVVNPLGQTPRGGAGPINGILKYKVPLQAAHLVELWQHLFRAAAKTTLETGVFRYRNTPNPLGVDTSFSALVSRNPVTRLWLYGVKVSELSFDIGDNSEIEVDVAALAGHGTGLGLAIPDEGNTGTYTLGPYLRGPLKDAAAGDVYLKVVDVSPTLVFRVEQTTGTPTFAGADVDAVYDGATGRGVYQNLQDQDGVDLGIIERDVRDPLEVIWPGTATDHGDLAVGDIFQVPAPGTWSDPSLSILSGFPQLTSAHWVVEVREVGATTWLSKTVESGKVSIAWPLKADRGSGTRYVNGIDRVDEFQAKVTLKRNLYDELFSAAQERDRRLQVRLKWEGPQIGASGTHREGLTLLLNSARLDSIKRPIPGSQQVKEEVELIAEIPDSGDPSVQLDTITTRNWTPAT